MDNRFPDITEKGDYSFSKEALRRVQRLMDFEEEIHKDLTAYIDTLSDRSVFTLLDCIRLMVQHTLEKDPEATHVWFTKNQLTDLVNRLFNMLELAKFQISLVEKNYSIMHYYSEISRLKEGKMV